MKLCFYLSKGESGMFFNLYDKALVYFAAHPVLNALGHFAAGFGLVVLLQHYLKGNALFPAWLGWALVLFAAVVHFLAVR